MNSELILRVKDLQKSFGAVIAAEDINVDVNSGEIVGIIGANGAGKTTFINMVTGYLKPTSGNILFRGREITGLEPRRVTQLGICRSFQISQVFKSLSVYDNLLTALAIAESPGVAMFRSIHRQELTKRCDEILERYRINEYRDQEAGNLPQGVRKLLDIAMAVVSKPQVLLLDEPTSGVSIDEKFEIMDLVMSALKEEKTTVLFIEHDMEIVERYVNRVLAFYQGRIICDKLPADAFVDSNVQEFVIGVEHHRKPAQNSAVL